MNKPIVPPAKELDAVVALKATPPRTRKDIVVRPRLDRRLVSSKIPVLMIQAPMGYGKTLLLAQWRRRVLDTGGVVAWLTLDESDDVQRFLDGVLLSIRHASGRFDFCLSSTRGGREPDWHLRTAAEILAGWAELARPLALVLDDFDRVKDARARAVGEYFMANLPSNGRLLMGCRTIQASAWMLELQADDQLIVIHENELAFTFEESVAFLQQRVDANLSSDLAARIHDLTGGWPIGLELCASTALEADDPIEGLADVRRQWRKVSGNLLECVTATWSPEMKSFLVEISLLKHLSVELCAAVTGRANTAELVEQLRAKSGLLLDAEDRPWFRLHHLAADHLREAAARLPRTHLNALHRRAATWLMTRSFWADAAAHALEAGETAMAFDAMEHSLRSLLSAGRFELIDSWLTLLPAHEIVRRQRLRLSAAIRLAIRGVPQYRELVADLERSGEPRLQFAAAVVHALAASHADDPDAASAALRDWRDASVSDDQPMVRAYCNIRRWLGSLEGNETAVGSPVSLHEVGAYPLSGSVSMYREALALMRAAKPQEASELLRPGLALLERALGRRSPPAVLLAVTMATLAVEQDDFESGHVLLADRLDLIDPALLPDGLAFGFQSAAAVAYHDGQAERAEDLLRLLLARAAALELPRIRAYALCELIKLQLAMGDHQAARGLLAELLDLDRDVAAHSTLNGPSIRSHASLSRARFTLAVRDGTAMSACDDAIRQARFAGHLHHELDAQLMRCAAAELSGQGQRDLLARSARVAQAQGCRRMLREADPILQPQLQAILGGRPKTFTGEEQSTRRRPIATATLTAREAQVLTRVSEGLSNKDIAICLAIGEGTIKWHLKNLFLKFGAADRQDLVARARLLGLIDA